MLAVNDKCLVFGLERGYIKITISPIDDWLPLLDKHVFESVELGGFTGVVAVNLETKRCQLFPLPSMESNPRHGALLLQKTAVQLASRLG